MLPKFRSNYYRFTLAMLIFMGGLLGWLYYKKIHAFFFLDKETNFTLYHGFGISLPDGYALHGIDVSRYQQRINWPMVRQMKDGGVKLGFAIIKASEGIGLVDAQYKRNWKKAKENNLPRGAYHYFSAYKSGQLQASLYINTVDLKPGDLPPILDIEMLDGASPAEMQQNVADWLAAIEAYYKVKPIIYSNTNFYNKYLAEKFSDYPLWVAHYLEKQKPNVSRHWNFWQHSDAGHVNGIDGTVDFNVFNGDSTEFNALLIPRKS